MTDQTNKKAVIVWGGWSGHTPQECAQLFAETLTADGYDVAVHDAMDVYADADAMAATDLIVPIWTMGEIADEQWNGLNQAVQNGTGIAGFHGGMIDAFRMNTQYQWMTGAQWVSHPGNCIPSYEVKVSDIDHEITRGLNDFVLENTEQYYCHHDPGNNVLCTTTFTQAHGDPSLYNTQAVHPYAWTKTWGRGRVFCAAWGHTCADFDVPEAREIVRRGMHWATRG